MTNFKRILLVFEGKLGEDSVLKTAVAHSKRAKANITVVAVIEKKPGFKEIQEMIVEESLKHLEAYVRPVKKKGVKIGVKVLIGTPFLEVIREVLKDKYDLVMINAEGAGAPKRGFIGSTTLHLMRKCPCPVWAIKPKKGIKINRVLAAVDPVDPEQSDADVRNGLNVKILDLAATLARSEGSRLDVFHAWSLYGESIIRHRMGVQKDELGLMLKKTRENHKRWLDQLLKQVHVPGSQMRVHLLKGEPGSLIPIFAKEKRTDLLVMGSVGRIGVPGFLIGNTAEKILHQVDCSVLAVKPDGYVSPVKL